MSREFASICHALGCYAPSSEYGNPLYCTAHQSVMLPGEPPVPQTPPPATPALLGAMLAKLEAAIAANDDLVAKVARIEKLLTTPVAVYKPEKLTVEQRQKMHDFCSQHHISSPILSDVDLVAPTDPDRITLPLDIDADLLQRFQRYCAAWKPDVPVNTILIQLIEDFLPRGAR